MIAPLILRLAAIANPKLSLSRSAERPSDCLGACAELNQRPACITTFYEHDAAVAALGSTEVAFMGNVLLEVAFMGNVLLPGTTLCSSGAFAESVSSSWEPDIGLFGQPDDQRWLGGAVGVLEGCILLLSANGGRWVDVPCGLRRSAPCLCEANDTVASLYNETLGLRVSEENAAFSEDAAAAGLAWGVTFAIAAGVFLLVQIGATVYIIIRGTLNQIAAHGAQQQQHQGPSETAAQHQATSEAASTATATADAGRDSKAQPLALNDDDEVALRAAAKLDSAKLAALRVRKSVGVVAQITLALCIFFVLPLFFVCLAFGLPIAPALIALTLAIAAAAATGHDPTDPRRVRMQLGGQAVTMMPLLAAVFCGAAFGFVQLSPHLGTFCSTRDPRCQQIVTSAVPLVGVFALIFWLNTLWLLPTMYASRQRAYPDARLVMAEQKKLLEEAKGSHNCCQRKDAAYLLEGARFFEEPIGAALDRWYASMRVLGVLIGIGWIGIGLYLHFGPLHVLGPSLSLGGFVPAGVVMTLVFPVALSPAVRRATVAWLGRLGSAAEERQAAAVAAFMGELDPAQALALAKRTFVGLEWGAFNVVDMQNTDLAASTSLRARTTKLRLGTCDAFLSHSWHDELTPKWAELEGWAAAFEQGERRRPVLWLDKACIDQENIDASLACLPVFLAGCQRLLVLAGPTYVTRLWCICEIFTFIQMGSELSRVQVVPIRGGDVQFHNFQVAECRCFKSEDKAKLMTAIESAFGSHTAFDVVMRTLLITMSSASARDETLDVSEVLRRGTSKFGGLQRESSNEALGSDGPVTQSV